MDMPDRVANRMRNWLVRTLRAGQMTQTQRLYYKGQTQAASGLLDAALESFRGVLEVEPSDIPARIALANILSARQQRDLALAELKTVLQDEPRNLQARLMKGHVEAAMSRMADAIRTFEEYLELAPDDPVAWQALGDCYFGSTKDGVKAERAYRSALAGSPSGFAGYRGLGESLARQKRLDEAQGAHDAWFRSWIRSPESHELRRRQNEARQRGVPAIMLVAMLKSASEFIRENLMRALDAPEMYINIGTVPRDKAVPSAVRQLAEGGAVSRSHLSGDNLSALVANGIDRLILHVRDPRQVTISWTHMIRRLSSDEFRYAAYMYDPPLPEEFRNWELQRQLDWAVQNFLPGQLEWLEGWTAALDNGPAIPVTVSKFEEFRQDQDAFFRKISNFYGISEIHLPKLSEQSAAAMRNFRSGQVDEWRAVLRPEQISSFRSRFEPLAERFGWELETPVPG